METRVGSEKRTAQRATRKVYEMVSRQFRLSILETKFEARL